MGILFRAANSIVRDLFEPPCAGCRAILHEPLARPICQRCWLSIQPPAFAMCVICGDELSGALALTDTCARCEHARPTYSIARYAGVFDGALREIVHAFKFERQRSLADVLAERMRVAGGSLLADADVVVPVPLHPIKSMRRGFNQADDLARQLRTPVLRCLRRRRLGHSQTSLAASQRRRNLHDHFDLRRSSFWGASGSRRLAGATVVLIDDVMTTGATVEACSRVLRDAGAAEVRVLTAARAVAGRPTRPPAPLHPGLLPR